jgi:DNA-binding Xre family transcriptional regulator
MSNAPTNKRTVAELEADEPSAKSLADMPPIDFSKVKRTVRKNKGKERVSLALLRRAQDLTQVQVAERAGIHQSEVARLEARTEGGEDVRLSTLQRYARALGGELEVAVVFPGDRRARIAL